MDSHGDVPVPVCADMQADAGGKSSATLDQRFVRAVAWTGGVKWSTQVLSWAATLVLARVLSPADYGVVGMATVFVNLIMLLSDFGLGSAIVIVKDLSNEQVSQLNTIAIGMGLACFALSCALAAPISKFFGVANLTRVILATSLAFVISGFAVVPGALLQKQLLFKLLAGFEVARALVGSGVAVVLALRGWGYWSLVWANVAGTLAFTALTVLATPRGFRWPQRATVGHPLRIGNHILVNTLSWYAYTNADFVVAGRWLGQAALGSYTMAWNTAGVPVQRVATLIARVSPSFFSAVQTDNSELRRYLLRLTEVISLLTFPASIGLVVVAAPLCTVAFGPKWQGAILPLQFLGLAATFRCIAPLIPHVLNVTGETRFGMWTSLGTALVLPACFLLASRWGTGAIAATWLFVYPLTRVPNYWRAMRKISLTGRDLLTALRPALTCSAVMAAAVVITRSSLPSDSSDVLKLAAEVATGVVAYAAMIFAFHRERVVSFARLMRTQSQAIAT